MARITVDSNPTPAGVKGQLERQGCTPSVAERIEVEAPSEGEYQKAVGAIKASGYQRHPIARAQSSGHSMDNVKVHYNSSEPASLQAHAYAQGTDIHLASGQERHLPHEAWHIVQQAQGRVKPTTQT